MSPESARRAGGFALPAVIFLIVIVGLMAIGMVQLVGTSQQSVSQEITSLRAYLAAQSGLQWGMYETVYPPGGGLTAAPQQLGFTTTGLAGATTTVNIGAAGAGGATYDISADGDYAPGSPEYAHRSFSVRFRP